MKRFVCSLFALALAAAFVGCEGHSVDSLPPHYEHKLHHGHSTHETKHPPVTQPGETKDPNVGHKAAGQQPQ